MSRAASSTMPTSSGAPAVFAFRTVPDVIACTNGSIGWNYNGSAASSSPFPLVVTNIGVSQSPEVTTTSRLVGRQGVGQINETLAGQINPSAQSFDWNPVNVAQGWYILVAYISQFNTVESNNFLVVNGSDMSCLASTSSHRPSSDNPSSSGSSSSFSSLSSSPSTVGLLTAKSNNAGKIAGGVIGGLALIAMVVAILFFKFLRRRRSRSSTLRLAVGKLDRPKSAVKTLHSLSESTGAILFPEINAGHPESPQTPPSSSEEDISTNMETIFVHNDAVAPLPNRNLPASTTSSLKSYRQRSTSGHTSHEIPEPSVPLQQLSNSNPGRSADSTSFFQNQRQSETSLPIPPLTVEQRSPKDHDRSPSSRRASRKPVPAYDASEVDISASSGDISMNKQKGHPTATHSSLVTEHGDKPVVHYLIPDVPSPVKR